MMRLPIPGAPFSRIKYIIGPTTIDLSGKYLVICTGDKNALPDYNEFVVGRTLSAIQTFSFTDDTDSYTGLHNMLYPWISVLDPNNNITHFFLFSTRPKQLEVITEDVTNFVNYSSSDNLLYESSDEYLLTANDTPMITKLVLYPGNGQIYHGTIFYTDILRDSNSDGIPDFLDASVAGSITKFLKGYDFSTRFYYSSDNYLYVSSDDKTLEVI